MSQTFTEFPIPNGYQSAKITTGPDGNLWFAEYSNIGRVTPQGVITLFPTPQGSNNTAIVTGSDGNLWFTETANDIIGRITLEGVVTEFPTPSSDGFFRASPADIVAGPDGNLWFTANDVDVQGGVYGAIGKIGRITTAGLMTEFSVTSFDTSFSGVTKVAGITSGPDGNLWFTRPGDNTIGRLTKAGVLTTFPIPTFASNPSSITVGPDGNLWFTEINSGKIGRVTIQGAIVEFPVSTIDPVFCLFLVSLVKGPDGNLWFTEFFNSTIGRVTPSGIVTEFPLPVYGAPYGLSWGPDGNLWYTIEAAQDRIGRFTLPQPPAPGFYTLAPCRVLDTRLPDGPLGGPGLTAGQVRVFSVAGTCGIPQDAVALVVNLTVTAPSSGGFLVAYRSDIALPGTTSISFPAGRTRANNGIVSVSPAGQLSLYAGIPSGGVEAIIDVVGVFR